PTLVALGLGGIIFGLRAFEEDVVWEAGAAGALFGLGFLAKGYAVGLFLAPLLAALFARPSVLGLGRTKRSLAALFAAFVVVGGSHLALTAAVALRDCRPPGAGRVRRLRRRRAAPAVARRGAEEARGGVGGRRRHPRPGVGARPDVRARRPSLRGAARADQLGDGDRLHLPR